MNTYFIETWGCQMNDLDSQRLSGALKLRGYRRVEDEREAGLILLNTCSIREKSEHKVFSRLGELRELKLERRELRIGVCGCVAQQEGERLRERAPWVDFVMGPGNVGYLDEVLNGGRRIAIDFPDDRRYDYLTVDRPSATKASCRRRAAARSRARSTMSWPRCARRSRAAAWRSSSSGRP